VDAGFHPSPFRPVFWSFFLLLPVTSLREERRLRLIRFAQTNQIPHLQLHGVQFYLLFSFSIHLLDGLRIYKTRPFLL